MGNKVNKTTYILLAIFLGSLGVHQFYSKNTKYGVLYLLFSLTFVPMLLSYYDVFKAVITKSDENGKIEIPFNQKKFIPVLVVTSLLVITVIFAPKKEEAKKVASPEAKVEKKIEPKKTKKVEAKKETKPSKETTVSSSEEPFDPATYPLVDFNAWNHDDVEYASKLQVTGTVIQAMKSDEGMNLRLAINDDYDQVVLITIEDSDYQDVIAEDDNVTVYGLNAGLTSYKTVMGNEQTIPAMLGTNYTVNSYGQ